MLSGLRPEAKLRCWELPQEIPTCFLLRSCCRGTSTREWQWQSLQLFARFFSLIRFVVVDT
jgi:hypothetical protein